jgi:hypothetical protein
VKKTNFYNGRVVAAIAAMSAVGCFAAPASANSSDAIAQTMQSTPSDSVLIARSEDLCRKVANPPEGLLIRSDASTSASQVGGVGRGGTVTLTTAPPTVKSDSAKRKWVEISAPKAGWISNGFPGQAGHLVMCAGAKPPEPPVGSTCRRVIRPGEGLLIRSEPNKGARVVGGVGLNQRMTLTTDPATVRKDGDGRSWIQISAPVAGWVSNGFPPNSNTGACP